MVKVLPPPWGTRPWTVSSWEPAAAPSIRACFSRCSASEGLSLEALEALLYRGSGLLALSGVSPDMREIERLDDQACRFAIEHFCYWAARHAGSLAIALGGIDTIAFSAGIGSHSAQVRAGILSHLQWLGIELDPERNARDAPLITTGRSRCPVWVVTADEELAILRHVHTLLA